MEKMGALDYPNFTVLCQLGDAVTSKLAERVNQHLTSNQIAAIFQGHAIHNEIEKEIHDLFK